EPTQASMGLDALLRFNEELLGIVRSGIPLDQGLEMIARETGRAGLSQAIERVRVGITQGKSLSQALADEGKAFPKSYVNLVAVGERMGSLTGVLEHLVVHYQRQTRFRDTVRSAAVYPATVLVLILAVTGLVVYFVAPSFVRIYSEVGARIPAPTRFVIDVSRFLTAYWPAVLLVAGGLVVYFLYSVFVRDVTRHDWPVLRHAPLFSRLYQYQNSSTFLSTMGMLLERGIPVPEALGVARTALISRSARLQLDETLEWLERGEPLDGLLGSLGFLTPISRAMLRMGCGRGNLGQTMLKTAEHYDLKVQNLQADLGRLIEPLLIVALGVTAGFFIASLYMPLFHIGDAIG
ncbi:MAG TPA: type II secretion system F family protein, partial [Sumerlaeia bacterium]|nr:type II secretion system F family protein [Sumerlaeia bacterium]